MTALRSRHHQFTGLAIRRRRQALGLSQRALAERAGMAQAHLSRLECGQIGPSLLTVAELAHALELTPAELVTACLGDVA